MTPRILPLAFLILLPCLASAQGTSADYERAFGALVPVVVTPIAPVEPFAPRPSNRAPD